LFFYIPVVQTTSVAEVDAFERRFAMQQSFYKEDNDAPTLVTLAEQNGEFPFDDPERRELHMARRAHTRQTSPPAPRRWQNVTVCINLVLHNNKPWFQVVETDGRPIVYDVYRLGYAPPFEVMPDEVVYIRDDGSWSLPYSARRGNRIVFPHETCKGVVY
jgi:hypothetical protein